MPDAGAKQPQLVYDPALLVRVLQMVKTKLIPGNYHKQGYMVLRSIEQMFHDHPELSRDHPDLFQDLSHSAVLLQFFCLNRLNDKDALELIQNHFVDMFEISGYDLENKFSSKLLTKLYFIDQDEFKDKVKRALLLNKQHITKGKPVFHNIEQSGTVANWLKDFTSETAGKPETLAFFEYLENSKNTRYLSDSDRERLRVLLKFYTKLHYSSFTVEGTPLSFTYVDDNGHLMSFKDGELEDVSSDREVQKIVDDLKAKGLVAETPQSALEESDEFGVRTDEGAQARYAPQKQPAPLLQTGGVLSEDEILETSKEIVERTLGEFDPLVSHLSDAVRLQETLAAVSALYVLNKLGFLGRLLKEDTEIRQMYEEYLKRENSKELFKNFQLMPGSADHLLRCVKFLLIHRLRIPRKEAEELLSMVVS